MLRQVVGVRTLYHCWIVPSSLQLVFLSVFCQPSPSSLPIIPMAPSSHTRPSPPRSFYPEIPTVTAKGV